MNINIFRQFTLVFAFVGMAANASFAQGFWQEATLDELRSDRGGWEISWEGNWQRLRDVAVNGTQAVAVGDYGQIVVSDDLETWTSRSSGTIADLRAVAYGAGTWVVSGGDVLLTSGDRDAWTSREFLHHRSSALAYSSEHGFVSVGTRIRHSEGGLEWAEVLPNGPFSGVAFGNGRYVAVSSKWTTVAISSNGTEWEGHSIDKTFQSILFFEDRFWGVTTEDRVASSENGETWILAPESEDVPVIRSLGAGQGLLVGGADDLEADGIFLSKDGSLWVPASEGLGPFGAEFQGAVATEEGLIALVHFSNGARIVRTTPFLSPLMTALAVGGGKVVSGGFRGRLFYFDDDGIWKETQSPLVRGLRGIGYGNEGFVAVGESGALAHSPDGILWEARTVEINTAINAVGFGANRYVAVGDRGEVIWSDDGANWEKAFSGIPSALQAIAYGAGEFVAVGFEGTILRSPDGISWVTDSFGLDETFTSVTYGHGRFVVAGSGGRVLVSAGEGRWLLREVEGIPDFRSLIFANDRFVGAGHDGRVLVSSDGWDWEETARDEYAGIHALAFDGERFHAAGNRLLQANLQTGASLPVVWAASGEVAAGEEIVFSASHEAGGGAEIQWFKDGVLIPGATGADLTLSNAGMADTGTYSYLLPWMDEAVESTPFALSVSGTYDDWAGEEDAGAPEEDSGGRGIPNLLRYGFALDAATPRREYLPTVDRQWALGGSEVESVLTLRFRLNSGATDLSWTVQSSANLQDWLAVPAENVSAITDLHWRTVILESPEEAATFWRVRMDLIP